MRRCLRFFTSRRLWNGMEYVAVLVFFGAMVALVLLEPIELPWHLR